MLRRPIASIALALLLGCPRPPPAPPPVDWQDKPRVPSPTAGTYAQVPGVPVDPGVAALVAGRTYDASLAGAAAGIGLRIAGGTGGLSAPELREAAWRAGWAWPIRAAQVWVGDAGRPPPPDVEIWLGVQRGSIGLVRVRAGLQDLWVGLASEPRADLGPVPRQVPVGATLALPATPGARLTTVDPGGATVEVGLDTPSAILLDQAGEWLAEIRDDRGLVATFPVYAGMVPPSLELLVPGAFPADDAAATAQGREAVTQVREAYGLPPLEEDPILLAAARAWQADPSVSVAEVARRAGLVEGAAWRWTCTGTSVASCVDSIVWDVRARPGLLLHRGLWGLVAHVDGDTVRVVAAVGAPRP